MATVDPTIALSAKAPDAMTGLGQMLNVARGVQAYQQQAESFPTVLEQQKLALNRSQQMLPIEVRQAEATAGASELGLNQKQLTLAGGMLTGLEYSEAFKKGDIPELTSQVKTIEHVLKANGVPVEKTFGQVNSMLAAGDIKGVQNFIGNLRTGLASAEQKYSAALPQPMAGLNAPAAFTAGGPQGGTIQSTPIGTPAAPVQAPIQAPMTTVAPGVQTAPVAAPTLLQGQPLPAAPTGVTPQQMSMPPEAAILTKPVPLPYPVRKEGQPYMPNPSEAADTAKNIGYREGLIARQTDLTQSRRNIQEVISLATKIEKESSLPTTGPIGAIKRKFADLVGDPTYKQLSKDLANIQISNIKAQGGSLDTVGGQQLTRMASGDETYPPDVLIKIARRTDADSTNIDMQATAAAKFAAQYGDNNLNAFKQAWSKNADSKVFEAINIYRDAKDVKEAKTQIDELLGKDPKQRKIFFQKYQNIQKLFENGTL